MAARFSSLDRAVWMTAAGAGAVGLSALLTWSQHPSASHSGISSGELVLVEELFVIDQLLRIAAVFVAVLFLALAWRRARPNDWHLRIAWTLPAVALAAPCWLAQFHSQRMAERALLYQQMNRVADDMDANLHEQQVDWRSWQVVSRSVVADVPLVRAPLKVWEPASFSPVQANLLVEEVLGLGPAFLGFVRPTLLAVFGGGVVLLLCGLHLARGSRPPEVARGVAWGAVSAALFAAIPLGPRVIGEYHLVSAERAARRGEVTVAMAHLRAARVWKPGLEYSWSYHRRLGELARLQDRPYSLEAELADAHVALADRRPQDAVEQLRHARTLYPNERSVVRFLAVALAESGIDAFNIGQTGLAKDYWEESLAYAPTDPISWYGLSLVHGRLRRPDMAARCLEQVARLNAYFGYRRFPVRSQAVVARSWAAFRGGNLAEAHELYGRALRPGTW